MYLILFSLRATPSERWISTCQTFLIFLTSDIEELRNRIAESAGTESCLTYRFSYILSLTTYAQILFVLAMSPSSSQASAAILLRECSTAIEDVITTVDEIEPYELLTVSGVLGVSDFSFLRAATKNSSDDLVSCASAF